MWSATIVVGQEGTQRSAALDRRGVRHRIRPFPQERLNKPLRFAVGPRRVGARPPMADVQPVADRRETRATRSRCRCRSARAARGCRAPEPGDGPLQKRRARRPELVGEDFDIGDAAVIVDRDVHVLPADAAAGAPAIAVDPMADTADAAQGLDVDVNHVARPRPFVALNRHRRRDGRAIQPQASQPAVTVERGIRSAWPIAHAGRPCCSRSH